MPETLPIKASDHPKVGQNSQYKRVCCDYSDGRTNNFRLAGLLGRNHETHQMAPDRQILSESPDFANNADFFVASVLSFDGLLPGP